MEETSKHGRIGDAAMKPDMHRETARKYIAAGKLPSEMTVVHGWRTRPDPFEEHWPEIEARLRDAPELEAKTLFEVLQEAHPGRYDAGQLRTLQRRVKRWRAAHGPDQEVVLAQQHRPGEAAQTDFTHATELAVTIAGQVFVHLLCVLVLPYSNWQWFQHRRAAVSRMGRLVMRSPDLATLRLTLRGPSDSGASGKFDGE